MAQRVHVPNNSVLGSRVIVIIVQVLGKYMIIRHLDPEGKRMSLSRRRQSHNP